MARFSNPHLLSFTIFIISKFITSPAVITKLGFTVELIHRDSIKSPVFDNTTTPFQKFRNAIHRSEKRASRFILPKAETKQNVPISEVFPNGGEYLMSYSLGNPKVQTRGLLDTGSDLTWLQCAPCNPCFPSVLDFFVPANSRSNGFSNCLNRKCRVIVGASVDRTFCDASCFCGYEMTYGDGSTTVGTIYYDTLTLATTSGGTVAFPRFIYGCGYQNDGRYTPASSGIVGIGRGQASLVRQIYFSIQGKFAYCLLPYYEDGSSKLMFGENALVSGPDVAITPMLSTTALQGEYYFVDLEAISVGEEWIVMDEIGENGNILLDSGSTTTLLPPEFYRRVEAALSRELDLIHVRVNDPTHTLNLCYQAETAQDIEIPLVYVHFRNADINLDVLNIFSLVSNDVACFTFLPAPTDLSIYGALAQANFVVGFDLQGGRISFKKADCTTF